MCLYTDCDFKIAKDDIHCYKILYKRKFRFPRSPFFHKLYIHSIKYKISDLCKVPTCRNNIYKIYEGFHMYTDLYQAIQVLWNMKDSWISGENLKLYSCVIPKGSKYCIGSEDINLSRPETIVSNQIIIYYETY